MEKKKINQNIFKNIILALAIILYFIALNFAYYRFEENNILLGLKISSMVFLFLSIIIFEISYKKNKGIIAIYGIEILFLAMHSLSISHVVQLQELQFSTYIIISAFAFVVYYVLKSMILYTIEKRRYLQSLSDIKEIVDTKPTKKEAKKRKNKKEAIK